MKTGEEKPKNLCDVYTPENHFALHKNEQRTDLNQMPGTSFKGKINGGEDASTKRHSTTIKKPNPL